MKRGPPDRRSPLPSATGRGPQRMPAPFVRRMLASGTAHSGYRLARYPGPRLKLLTKLRSGTYIHPSAVDPLSWSCQRHEPWNEKNVGSPKLPPPSRGVQLFGPRLMHNLCTGPCPTAPPAPAAPLGWTDHPPPAADATRPPHGGTGSAPHPPGGRSSRSPPVDRSGRTRPTVHPAARR